MEEKELTQKEYLGLVLDTVAKEGGRGLNLYCEEDILEQLFHAKRKGMIEVVEVEGLWKKIRQNLSGTFLGEIPGFVIPKYRLTRSGEHVYKRLREEKNIPERHGSYSWTAGPGFDNYGLDL